MTFLKYFIAWCPLTVNGTGVYHEWRSELAKKLGAGENINEIRGCPNDRDIATGQVTEGKGKTKLRQRKRGEDSSPELKKNLANKIFGYLARCEFWPKLGW